MPLLRTLGAVARAVLLPARSAARLYETGRANQHFFLPVLNGALGDQLAARHDSRAIPLSFRRGGHDVAVADLGLSEHRQKTVVFVHGLMGDEKVWQSGTQDDPAGPLRYGPRLAAEAGMRPLYVRYNSGLHISENGRALSQLLSELVTTYPEALGELVLVGHSMGGLVVRSAGYYGSASNNGYQATITYQPVASQPAAAGRGRRKAAPAAASVPANPLVPADAPPAGRKRKGQPTASDVAAGPAPWLAHLHSVFLLGVPHDGSYLEQNSALVERLLRRIDLFPTRFLSDAFARRSNGIKDLGEARLVDEDWQQPDDPALPRPRTLVPLLTGVRYHVLMGAWLRAGRAQALRDYFGDGLVGTASGQGQQQFGDETTLPPGTSVRTARFEQQHHSGLLHNPEVYQYLRQWA